MAACYVVDTRIGHADAEGKDLPAVRAAAAELGYDDERLQLLLAEVGAAYEQDRGQGLVAAV